MKQNKTIENVNKSPKQWHLINAEGQVLGRIAVQAAKLLIGKDNPNFMTNINKGGSVIIINAEKIRFTGKKLKDKIYKWHTMYPKGLREETLEKYFARKPQEVIRQAIKGMLPDNKLKRERINNLHIYVGNEHPHQAQSVSK